MQTEHFSIAAYRDSKWRILQNAFQSLTPSIVNYMYFKGMLDNTVASQAVESHILVESDHLTLAGLQLTVAAAREIVTGKRIKPLWNYTVGNILDLFDGSLARHRNKASADGAVKDVISDRLVDIFLTNLIEENLKKNNAQDFDMTELKIAFQLSTLTKAASEMLGVKTKEAGSGSMVERRRKLIFILYNLGCLNINLSSDQSAKDKIITNIKRQTDSLITRSIDSSKKRIAKIYDVFMKGKDEWVNNQLGNKYSSAAVDARKYAAVLRLSEREGLKTVEYLNSLADYNIFPDWNYWLK